VALAASLSAPAGGPVVTSIGHRKVRIAAKIEAAVAASGALVKARASLPASHPLLPAAIQP